MPGKGPLKIIRARRAHLNDLVPLFEAYLRFYRRPSSGRRAGRFLMARLRRRESAIFLARQKGRALGFVQLYPSFGSLALQRVWILYDLYVAPAARRRGVGEALLRRARQFARQSGAHSLWLETAVGNRPARRLYEKQGWKKDTKFHRYYFAVAAKS